MFRSTDARRKNRNGANATWSALGFRRSTKSHRRPVSLEVLEFKLMLNADLPQVEYPSHSQDHESNTYAPPSTSLVAYGSALTDSSERDPLEIATSYLMQNAAALGLGAGDLDSYQVTDSYQTSATGVTHIYLQQTFNGLPIENARININVLPDGKVLNVGSSFVAGLESTFGSERFGNELPQAAINAADALQSLSIDFGWTLNESPYTLAVEYGPANRSARAVYSASGISRESIPVQLQYVPSPEGSVELAWRMNIQTLDGRHWYDASVSAVDGEVLLVNDWMSHAQYEVFAQPIESPSFGDRTQEVDPQDIDASPFGWHDTNGATGAEFTTTQGNNVHAYADRDDNNLPDSGSSPDGGGSLLFNFPLDLNAEPLVSQPAAVTNLFYWNNRIHDIMYQYGFDEPAGNFQANNYGNGGAGNDSVLAEAQDGADIGNRNNANFGTPPDGFNPRMQMFLWSTGTPEIDGDFDNGIVIHEYGHGISNRLTGGPGNAGALNTIQSGGMGEGWSDFFGLMLTQEPGDTAGDIRAIGTYALNNPTTGPGIRSLPYTYNFAVNDHTYADIIGTGSVHFVGEVWASVLWDLNWALIDGSALDPELPLPGLGFDSDLLAGYQPGGSGNQLALQLIMDGLKLQPANPSLLDARDSLLAADLALTGGVNQGTIWTVFARRGLGFSADDGGTSSTTNVTEAFDLPALSDGSIQFDELLYEVGQTITVSLLDLDLSGPQSVTVTSTGGDSEEVLLNDLGAGIYQGPLTTAPGAGPSSDGILQIESGDVITVTYVDENDGLGGTNVVKTDTALIAEFIDFYEADFSDDLGDPDLDGFTIDNSGAEFPGLWHISNGRGNDVGHSPDESMYFGQNEGPGGGGDYDVGDTTGTITSPIINLTDALAASLSFNYFLETESASPFDIAEVRVSLGGGPFLPIGSNHDGLLLDPLTNWTQATVDLEQFLGDTVQFQFFFDTLDSITNAHEGWYVDDIVVRAAIPPGVSLSATDGTATVSESGITSSYTINLNTVPDGPVELRVSADSQTEVSLDGVNFAPFVDFTRSDFTPQTITIRAIDDSVNEGLHGSTISSSIISTGDPVDYPTSLVIPSLDVIVLDNDVPGVTVVHDPASQVTEGGAISSYTINLDSIPVGGGVTLLAEADSQSRVSLDGIDFSNSVSFLSFDRTPQTIYVRAVDDAASEGNHQTVISHSIIASDDLPNYPLSLPVPSVPIEIVDNEAIFAPVTPYGSLIYDPPVLGDISVSGEQDTIGYTIDAGQTATIVVTPDSGLAPAVDVRNPSNASLTTQSSAAGVPLFVQTLPAAQAGTYSILLTGAGGSIGDYSVEVILNAAIEEEEITGTPNNSIGSAQSLLGSAIPLTPSSQRLGATGRIIASGYAESQTQSGVVFTPNVLQFDFISAPVPQGAGTLTVEAVADLDLTTEFLTLAPESLPSQDLFVTGAGQSVYATVDVPISLADLQTLAADSTISFTVTPSVEVNDFGGDSLTLTLTYPLVEEFDFYSFSLLSGESATLALESDGNVQLDLLDGTGTLLASGIETNNLSQVINNFVSPADDTFYARISGDGEYQLIVTQNADFDTESNSRYANAQDLIPSATHALGAIGAPSSQAPSFTPPAAVEESRTIAPNRHYEETGKIIVRFRDDLDEATAEAWLKSRQLTVVNRLHHVFNGAIVETPAGTSSLQSLVSQWTATPEVDLASLDVSGEYFVTPNDPLFVDQWAYNNVGQTGGISDADIDAPEAWDLINDSSSVVIAIVDSGVDYTHPDLAPNMWVNTLEIAGNGIDDDGNGYIDDVHGINGEFGTGDPADAYGHGTHVAGIAAAVGNNNLGVTGVNWNAQIMAFNIGTAGPTTAGAIASLDYVVDQKVNHGVNIVSSNHSYSVGDSPLFLAAIEASIDAGVIFVAGAGNAGVDIDLSPTYPASYPLDGIVTVAATDDRDLTASFTNFGSNSVDLGAPGVSVLSTMLTSGPISNPSGYGLLSGTSMASPMVTGAAGLLAAANPFASPAEIKQALLAGSDSIASLAGITVSGGRLNLPQTLQALEPVDDFYAFQVIAGDSLLIETTTPFDGPFEPSNTLDPALELFDPSGVLVEFNSNGAGDSKNALVTHSALQTGRYVVRVFSESDSGEYVLDVSGATGGDLPPEVISSSPFDGEKLPDFPLSYTVDFSESLFAPSINAADLLLGGLPALSVVQIDGDTLEFTIDPAVNIGDGTYLAEIAPDSVLDLQGLGNLPYLGTFMLDETPPIIVGTLWNGETPPADYRLLQGPLAFNATFSEAVAPVKNSDFDLFNLDTSTVLPLPTVNNSPDATQTTAFYENIPEGNYLLSVVPGDLGGVEDLVGNPLDGEPNGPGVDGTPTGDGIPGGFFSTFVEVDVDTIDALPFTEIEPLGGLIARSLENRVFLNSQLDFDSITFFAHAGETISAVVTPENLTSVNVELLGVAPAPISGAPGASFATPVYTIPADGYYQLELGGDSVGGVLVDIYRNTGLESFVGDSDEGNELAIDSSFVSLGSGRYGVVGQSSTGLGTPLGIVNNGSFETGDFSGWTSVLETGSPLAPWTVSQAGDGTGFLQSTSPQDGLFDAWNGFDGSGPMEFILTQDVVLPTGGAELSWLDRVQWDFTLGGTETVGREVRVEVRDPGTDNVLATVYTFNTGDQATNPTGDTGWQSHVADLTSFAGQSIRLAFVETVPLASTGPGQFEIDAIELYSLDPEFDEYEVNLSQGDSIDVILTGLENDFSGASVELLAPDGVTVLSTGSSEPLSGGVQVSNYDVGILSFLVPASDTYTVRVSSTVAGEYSLLVTENLVFDTEPNGVADPLRSLDGGESALGSVRGGDYVSEPVPLAFEDIAASGTSLSLGDDSVSNSLPLGFSFEFYADTYSNAYVSSNGFLTFLPSQSSGCCSGGSIPNASSPNAIIAGWWEDLNPNNGGTIHYQTLGTPGNQRFIVQFTSIEHFGGGNPVTMQFKLFEADNSVEVHYLSAPSDGGTHTVGIENAAGDDGIEYFRGVSSLPSDSAVRYFTIDQDSYQLTLEAGQSVSYVVEALLDNPVASPFNTLDPELLVLAPDGVTVVAADFDGHDGKNALVSFVAPVSGDYTLVVKSTQGSGSYLLHPFGLENVVVPLAVGAGSNDVTVRLNGSQVEIYDNIGSTVLSSYPLQMLDSLTILGSPSDPDRLVVDYAFGDFFSLSQGISFVAGASPGDALDVLGTEFTEGQWLAGGSNIGNGTLLSTDFGRFNSVEFSGVEPLGILGYASLQAFGSLHVGSNPLLLDVSTYTLLDKLTTLQDGLILAPGGLYLGTGGNVIASGAISAPFVSAVGSTINLTGDLDLGDGNTFAGVLLDGRLNIGAHTLLLHDGHKAVLGSQTNLGNASSDGTIVSDNGIALEDNRTLVGRGVVNTANGEFENQGFIQCNGPGITFNHLLTGAGDFGGSCTFLGGTAFGNSPALIDAANMTFGASNTHYVELGGLVRGSEFDSVKASGAVNLDGPLEVSRIDLGNGYDFALGDSFQVITAAGGVNGVFSGTSLPALSGGLEWEVQYNANDVTLLVTTSASVVGRQLFYNNSSFVEGTNDSAIATDKSALTSGQTATFSNYSNFVGGINGLMIDIQGAANAAAIDASSFQFRVGNNNDPSTWSLVGATPQFAIRPGQGTSGSDRVEITFPEGAIRNTWLEITILAGGNVGLAGNDVFYFGNAPGETGDSAADSQVNGTDFLGVRNNPKNFLSPADITNRFDHNRDGRVNATDLLIVRDFSTDLGTRLELITPASSFQANATAASTETTGRSELSGASAVIGSAESRQRLLVLEQAYWGYEEESRNEDSVALLLASMTDNASSDADRALLYHAEVNQLLSDDLLAEIAANHS